MSKNVVDLTPAKLPSGEARGLSEADRRGQADLIEWSRSLWPPQREPERPLTEIEEAIQALKREGHERFPAEMVEEWIATHKASPPAQPEPVPQEAPLPSPKRGRGRPPSRPWWLPEVARLVAGGLTLRRALRTLWVDLSVAERRNVYRWKRFRELLAEYRREHERDGGNFRD